jgi:hypothetical protein
MEKYASIYLKIKAQSQPALDYETLYNKQYKVICDLLGEKYQNPIAIVKSAIRSKMGNLSELPWKVQWKILKQVMKELQTTNPEYLPYMKLARPK